MLQAGKGGFYGAVSVLWFIKVESVNVSKKSELDCRGSDRYNKWEPEFSPAGDALK